jgi:hypothetical protein
MFKKNLCNLQMGYIRKNVCPWHYQPSLMLASKAGAYTRVKTPEECIIKLTMAVIYGFP